MKKYIIYSLIMTLTCGLGACNNDEDVDKANSIFSTEEVDRNPFDKWILGNYTHPYNIALKYRMEDNESDMTHILAPAEYKKSVVLAKIIKHVWLEAYDEATGNPNFLRQYIPKTIHFIGSPAYEDNGTMVLGTAEGGMKITLYNVNDINPDQIDINLLNDYYFEFLLYECTAVFTGILQHVIPVVFGICDIHCDVLRRQDDIANGYVDLSIIE